MLAAKFGHVSDLPSGYTQVNYLGGTGTQYIDTGVYLTQDHAVYIEFDIKNYGNIFGSRESATMSNFSSTYVYGPELIHTDFGSYSENRFSFSPSHDIRYKMVVDKTEYNLDGVTAKMMKAVDDFVTPTPALLFGVGGNPVASVKKMRGKIYCFSIKKNGILVLDFIPCVRRYDNKPGMYDAVTKKFFTNAGTGEFLWG